ncbi:MAG: FAD-dependent oxidoreductase, partial [Chlorobi bacterium]|nr:FAD-dependent oxidoreductase [Chlorobiota bacterium]
IETHIIELCDRLLPKSYDKEMSLIIEKQMASNNVALKLSTKVLEIKLSDESNPIVILDSGDSLSVDYVFLCAGVRPQTKLAESIGCKIGTLGGITVDEQLRTSVEGVWAGGDCIELNNLIDGSPAFFPLGSLANRQGRVIADSIAGRDCAFKGAVGSSSIQVFDLISASAGLTQEEALKNHPDATAVWGSWYDRPDYMPEYQNLFGKLIYDSVTLKLYGLQLSGKGEVTRYIDAFSAIASHDATVQDLIDFEHAYTPPHSGPMNPLNSLGAIAFSQSIDGIQSINPIEVEHFDGQIIDVREPAEAADDPLERDNRNISVADITLHIEEFDKSKPVLIVCQKGPRAYETARLFVNAGYKNVFYSGGGMQLTSIVI